MELKILFKDRDLFKEQYAIESIQPKGVNQIGLNPIKAYSK